MKVSLSSSNRLVGLKNLLVISYSFAILIVCSLILNAWKTRVAISPYPTLYTKTLVHNYYKVRNGWTSKHGGSSQSNNQFGEKGKVLCIISCDELTTSSRQSWVCVYCVRYVYWIGSASHVLMILKCIIDNITLHNSLVVLCGTMYHMSISILQLRDSLLWTALRLCIVSFSTSNCKLS